MSAPLRISRLFRGLLNARTYFQRVKDDQDLSMSKVKTEEEIPEFGVTRAFTLGLASMSKMTKICPCQNTEEETFEAMFAPVRIGVHFTILRLFGGSLNARIYYC